MENSAKPYKIRWSNKASHDYESVYIYIADVLKEAKTAGRIAALIYDQISNLVNFPLKHPVITSRFLQYSDVRRMPVGGYNVYYKVDEAQKIINIARILHSLQDAKGLL